ncbi:hypothetical protein RI367_004969 [Sorochytrium milnesiophthora]
MGGWTIYCFVCGGTPFADNACRYGDSPEDVYDMPEEDVAALDAACVVWEGGAVSPPGECDWPSPLYVKIADTPDNRAKYPMIATWDPMLGQGDVMLQREFHVDIPDNYDDIGSRGALVHAACADLFCEAMRATAPKLTLEGVFAYCRDHQEGCNGLIDGIDYAYGKPPVHGQDFELHRGQEWTTRRPDRFPSIPTLPPASQHDDASSPAALGAWQPVPLEILLLVVHSLPARELLAMLLTSKTMQRLLTGPAAQRMWKLACARNGWVPPNSETSNVDWFRFHQRCLQSDNMRNRKRIMHIINELLPIMSAA